MIVAHAIEGSLESQEIALLSSGLLLHLKQRNLPFRMVFPQSGAFQQRRISVHVFLFFLPAVVPFFPMTISLESSSLEVLYAALLPLLIVAQQKISVKA